MYCAGVVCSSHAKHSGANCGIGSYSSPSSSASVSPMRNSGCPTIPMTSPGHASSTVSRSRAKNLREFDIRTTFPVRVWTTFMSRRNTPVHTRRNAIWSRWFGSMFDWILKMNPLNPGRAGSSRSPPTVLRAPGGGAFATKSSSSSCTPKLWMADPKYTGVMSPVRTASAS